MGLMPDRNESHSCFLLLLALNFDLRSIELVKKTNPFYSFDKTKSTDRYYFMYLFVFYRYCASTV